MNAVATLPEVTAVVDGTPLPGNAIGTLHEMRVQQRLAMPGQCELAFSPPPPGIDPHIRFAPGNDLQLRIGQQQEQLFAGDITAVEFNYGPSGRQDLRVRAYDRLHRLRKRQPVREHREVTPRELAVALAADLGVTVQSTDPGPVLHQIIQHRQSDFELLVGITQRYGLYPYLRGNVLHLHTLEATGPSVSLERGRNLLEARIERNGEAACQKITAHGWDPLRVESRSGESATPRQEHLRVKGISPEALGGSGQRNITGQTAPNDAHLDAIAQAELDRRIAHETVLRAVAEGDPQLQPGTAAVITEIADGLDGRYMLTSVLHVINGEQGFVSEVSSGVPSLRQQSSSTLATLGVVTRVNDPENIGRIQAILPAYNEIETQWLHVVSPGAGAEKGLTAIPDVGDSVLVLCSDRDPGEGVVLGGLYGMGGPLDSGIEGNAVRRFSFCTPGGHRVQMDDENKTLHLQDSSGNRIKLSPERFYLHATGDLEVEAPGQSIVIRGQTIDFQRR